MAVDVQTLSAGVQKNCDISDALYARNYTLCIYLLKMRELYRWEKGYGYHDRLPSDELGEWLTHREARWERLEEEPFAPVEVEQRSFDPFDPDAVNEALLPHGLIYSGGYGRFGKPLFFLGELSHEEERSGFKVLVSCSELARDIVSPPAMMRGRTITVRRESVQRMLWEKIDEWGGKRPENPLAEALRLYGYADNPQRALNRMTGNELEAVILHEVGEGLAGEHLGPHWQEMLLAFAGGRAELYARAVRDHLADCLSTLPALIEAENRPSLHFYFANLSGLRRELFPRLESAYRGWREGLSGLEPLAAVVDAGRDHWQAAADTLLATHEEWGAGAAVEMEKLYPELTLA